MSSPNMAKNVGSYGCHFEEQPKCRSTVKTVCKNMKRGQSYDQTNLSIDL